MGDADTSDGGGAAGLAGAAIEVLRTRPLSAGTYAWRTLLFLFNYCFWKAVRSPRVRVGRNLHLLSTLCFQAERPHARIAVGDDFVGYRDCRVCAWGRGRIAIGDCCSIGTGSRVHSRASVSIGRHVLFSWDVLVMDFDGHSMDPERRARELAQARVRRCPRFEGRPATPAGTPPPAAEGEPIAIEDRVWLGARSVVLKGVRIGEGSVVAAGAVVTHDIPPRCLAAGNPARVVRELAPAGG